MQRQPVAFEPSYRRHLTAELRKAVLEVLAGKLDGEATVGEIVDAANALGVSEGVGELTLGDLADALLSASGEGEVGAESRGVAHDDEDDEESDESDEDEDEDEDDEDEDEDEDDEDEAPARGKAKGKATKAKPAAKGKKSTKAAAPAKGKGGRTKATVSLDERMSLQEAAKALVPLVQALGQATMQELEASTKAGRRKLRFHIGQLVRHGYLERHGMGRGTYYTAR